MRASTAAKLPRRFSFKHLSFGRTVASTSQLRTCSGTSEGYSYSWQARTGKAVHPFAGPTGTIRESIQKDKHKKWGYLFYRCDYSDDDAWNRFLSVIRYGLERHLRTYKAEDLLDTWELTVKEDSETLEGATVDQVRDFFSIWVQSDEANQFQSPGYEYCVHVDADAIDSVVRRAPQSPKRDFNNIGYATLGRLVPDYYYECNSGSPSGCDDDDGDESEDDEEDFTKMNDAKVPIRYRMTDDFGRKWQEFVSNRRVDGVFQFPL